MFKKILTVFLLLFSISPAFAVTQWNIGIPISSDAKSNWPGLAQAQWSIIDTLLSNYNRGMYLAYASSSSITVAPGEIVVSTAGASPRLFLQNTSALTLTNANLDVGAVFVANTIYYVYIGTSSATAATGAGYISLSNTAPSGVTYYAQIGQFTTDANNQITSIINNNWSSYVQLKVSKSAGVVYQALTDGMVTAYVYSPSIQSYITGYTDSSSSPSTIVIEQEIAQQQSYDSITFPVRKGDYYEVTVTAGSPTIYFFPIGK